MILFIKKYYLGLFFIVFAIDVMFFDWRLYGFYIPILAKYISGGILFLLGVYILYKQYKGVSVN
jgi:putative Mn2+ efflux pump MntP